MLEGEREMVQIWEIFAHGVVELIREFRFTCNAFIACVCARKTVLFQE